MCVCSCVAVCDCHSGQAGLQAQTLHHKLSIANLLRPIKSVMSQMRIMDQILSHNNNSGERVSSPRHFNWCC